MEIDRKQRAAVLHDLAERVKLPDASVPEVAVEVMTEGFSLYRAAVRPGSLTVVSPKKWAVELVRRLASEGLV